MHIKDFIHKMEEFLPGIKEEIRNYISYYGEGLDTCVIEDIIMPLILDMIGRSVDTDKIQGIFDYFEQVSLYADEQLKDIFSTTVLEMLGNDQKVLQIAEKYMGKETVKLQKEADFGLGRKENGTTECEKITKFD